MSSAAHIPPFRSLRTRILLTVFALVLCVCWLSVAQVLRTSRAQQIDRAFQAARAEQFMVVESIKAYANTILSATPADSTPAALGNALSAYARYYAKDSLSLQISDAYGLCLHTTMSGAQRDAMRLDPPQSGAIHSVMRAIGDQTAIFVSSYITIGESRYRIDIAQDTSDILRDAITAARRVALLLFAAILLLLCLLFSIIRVMLSPLQALGAQARKIACGQYGLRADARHPDEVGLLARDFNEMAEAVERNITALTQTVQARERYAANLAHELKTPMTSIIGYSDLAQRAESVPEPVREMLAYINREAKRLHRLSVQLLSLSELTHRPVAEARPCQSARVFTQVTHTLSPVLVEKNQRIRPRIELDILYADEPLLISLLVNLLKNAAQASGEGADIELSILPSGDGGALLTVADHGAGIGEEDLLRIREPFFMADKARSRRRGGMGLGLALSQAIVDAHGGRMEIESEPGNGTRVCILLPPPSPFL